MTCACCGGVCCLGYECNSTATKAECEECVQLGDCLETTAPDEENNCPSGYTLAGTECQRVTYGVAEVDCPGLWAGGASYQGLCGAWRYGVTCDSTPCVCSSDCNDCQIDAPSDVIVETGGYDVIPMGTVSGAGTPEDPLVVTDPDCQAGTRTSSSASVLSLDPPPAGISWKNGVPQRLLQCQAFWWSETRGAINYSNEYILGGSSTAASCKKAFTETKYRLFYIDCLNQTLVEVVPSTVATGAFTVTSNTTPGGCPAASVSGLQCSIATTPGAGDLPAAPSGPTLNCPP